MSEYMFGLGSGHLSKKVADAAEKVGAQLINYTDPGTGERRHWFTGPNQGAPFDGWLAQEVYDAIAELYDEEEEDDEEDDEEE
jgi:hypothetical protein